MGFVSGDIRGDEIMEDQRIVNVNAQPVHLTLTKNTKGYQWEISVSTDTLDNALATINAADDQLKAKYGASQE